MMKIKSIHTFAFIIFLCACQQTSSNKNHNYRNIQEQNDICDNPDADISCSFINTPASLTSIMTIATESEPGDKLVIAGIIYKPDGATPYAGVILYCYHTDSKGFYSKKGNETGVQKWHGRLHGWCRTDNNGRYEILTIRPAPYPGGSAPAHIHAAVKTNNGQMTYINDFVFKDDSLVNEKYVSNLTLTDGTGIVDVTKGPNNTWTGKRDIVIK